MGWNGKRRRIYGFGGGRLADKILTQFFFFCVYMYTQRAPRPELLVVLNEFDRSGKWMRTRDLELGDSK